jgi:hypothetical protein
MYIILHIFEYLRKFTNVYVVVVCNLILLQANHIVPSTFNQDIMLHLKAEYPLLCLGLP